MATKSAAGSLLGIESLELNTINQLLDAAYRMQRKRPRPLLKEKRVALLFYESSTRTRVSFEYAAKVLGATTTLVSATASSIEKGESLIDTGYTLMALGAQAIIIRHPSSGAPHLLSRYVDVPVINAGDGLHEHPSQALLDAYTILRHKKTLKGLRVALIGDIFHSRVARSNIHLLTKAGAHVALCGPPELVPDVAMTLANDVSITRDLREAVTGADVVIALRIQKERLAGLQLSLDEYIANYQLTAERVAWAKKDAIVMHPGPIIRGLELTADVADAQRTVIVEQVQNGVAVRMAILARALGVKH
ncbi:MAG TPA: aspartate carbamoyltransferase catalytic subunit [Terriglobales bacterium]|jgi:aspartate carbamoyltransferase catalytic subunit|nr:aspartate carbamoyltransferase catalytic subunit [Terriglobales bacterium]